jgi:hypothetical protein
MKLDFSMLSQPVETDWGQRGHRGHAILTRGSGVPELSPVASESGDNPSAPDAGREFCPRLSPNFRVDRGRKTPSNNAAVPTVPCVPFENEQVSTGKELTGPEMARQVSCWIAARCVRSSRAWGGAKFLFRDFVDWCEQSGQPSASQEQFAGILNELFTPDGNGWSGVCLAVDNALPNQ